MPDGTWSESKIITLRPEEIVVDLFAGGGGASTGIERALGRPVDVAVNHDPQAIAMHEANHPRTAHYRKDVWEVDPIKACGGRPVGLLWASPTCTDFSKAKGAPLVDRKVRALAWVITRWARAVRPRIIMGENVEEFPGWGPLVNGKRDKERAGLTFRRWVGTLKACGYEIQFRELRAHHYGAPTIRKRLFWIARCDGLPIVWPEPTHGEGLQPYATAASCIDWHLPTLSIFATKSEARAFAKKHGTGTPKRPLAKNTLRRIARGIKKFVIDAKEPFIVPVTHEGDARVHASSEPLRTVTTAHRGELAVVVPFVAPVKTWGGGGNDARDVEEPARTTTTSKRGEHAIVAPILARTDMPLSNAMCAYDPRDPLRTIMTGGAHAVIAPTLVQTGYGERKATKSAPSAQAPRTLDLHEPLTTVVACGQRHALVSAFLAKHFGERPTGGWPGGAPVDGPAPTVTTTGQVSVVAPHLVKLFGTSQVGQGLEEPAPTVRAGGTHLAKVCALLTRYNGVGDGSSVRAPAGTVTTKDRFALATVTLAGEQWMIVDIGLRMLTPRELFRCQGFPDWEERYKLNVEWLDHAIPAVDDRPFGADRNRVPRAGKTSSQKSKVSRDDSRAVVNARIDFVANVLELRSHGRSSSAASSAEVSASFPLPKAVADSVRELARLRSCEALALQTGSTGSRPNDSSSTTPPSGHESAEGSGLVTTRSVVDARDGTLKAMRVSTFITSRAGVTSPVSASLLRTLSSYVAAATSSFIRERIGNDSSFTVNLLVEDRYKIVPLVPNKKGKLRPLPRGDQIRMCGNSVVPILAEVIVRANLRASVFARAAA